MASTLYSSLLSMVSGGGFRKVGPCDSMEQ